MKISGASVCKALCAVLLIGGWGQANAANTAELTIKATVVTICTISLSKSSVNLGEVTVDTLKKTSRNTELAGMSDTLTVTSTCPGSKAAKLSVSTSNDVKDGYISPDGDALRFGIETTSNQTIVHKFDQTTKSTTLQEWTNQSDLDTGHTDVIKLIALAGANTSPSAGTYQATMTFKLEPE